MGSDALDYLATEAGISTAHVGSFHDTTRQAT
jgi:hypothetical protein